MGYPMYYTRLVRRNALTGDYSTGPPDEPGKNPGETGRIDIIRGDLRRLEIDQRDDYHLQLYADRSGLTIEQVKKVLDLFFSDDLYASVKP